MIKIVNEGDRSLAAAFIEAAELDPISGTRPQTLMGMFMERHKNVEFWIQYDMRERPSAAITRYGGQLCAVHGANADLEELEEFIRFAGGYETVSVSPSLGIMLKDLGETTNIIRMSREREPFPEDDFDLIAKPALVEVYSLLCAASTPFEAESDEAAWLVHTSQLFRRRLGYCAGIVREDGRLISTGGVYNSGKSHCVIGGLATLAEEKGNGYGGLICRYLSNRIIAANKTPALYAANESLAVYYGTMGFAWKGRWCSIEIRN